MIIFIYLFFAIYPAIYLLNRYKTLLNIDYSIGKNVLLFSYGLFSVFILSGFKIILPIAKTDYPESFFGQFLFYTTSVGCFEELSKTIPFLLFLLTIEKLELKTFFNFLMISAGFSIYENIQYLLGFENTSFISTISFMLLRGFISVPMHFLCTLIICYFATNLKKFTIGLLIASFVHGCFDFFLTYNNFNIIIMLPILSLIIMSLITYLLLKLKNRFFIG